MINDNSDFPTQNFENDTHHGLLSIRKHSHFNLSVLMHHNAPSANLLNPDCCDKLLSQ